MAQTFAAQVRGWTEKAERIQRSIIQDAAQTTGDAMTERQPSITETGSYTVGKVPVDTGFLINSVVADLNGGQVGAGPDAYIGAIAGMDLGDTVTIAFTAPYARFVEYGTSRMPGRFFVREAVMGWQGAVDAAAARFGDA